MGDDFKENKYPLKYLLTFMPWTKYAAAFKQWEELGRLSGLIRGNISWNSCNRLDLEHLRKRTVSVII